MIYLASPYSARSKELEHHRFEVVQRVAGLLILRGLPVFSPIVHCHEIAIQQDLPGTAEFWQKYNTEFVRRASELYVLVMPGWKESLGVQQEIELAKELFLPIVAVNERGLTHTEFKF